MNTEHRYANDGQLVADLAARIGLLLSSAVTERGRAVLAVSGGRSPIPLFAALSSLDLPWSAITVTLVDERCVTPNHPDSNARLVREHLLQGLAAVARFVPFFNSAPGNDGFGHLCAEAEARLATLPPPADVALLGMGADGHTASLFPNSPGFAQAVVKGQGLQCVQVHPAAAPHARITLTLDALLAARHRLLQFSGADKLAVYEQAKTAANPDLPVSLVLHGAPTEVWIGE
ncbi:MAG TPA: 6-phosphogluconolactonase [Rhodocyclaceae bacterium]|nr:6-phosphogluconolactonase [Rhodocyclaceae bacterium]